MEQTLDLRAQHASANPILSSAKSAASWPAIIAGAFVAAAVSLILFALGSGLGFASGWPWRSHGVSATTFAVTTAIWLILTQWVSSGVGGYIAGRLRTKWTGTHTHEVFFRDTAHGFVTWAVATVLVAAVFATSAFSTMGEAVHAQDMVPPSLTANSYSVDKLFRSAGLAANGAATNDPKMEAIHIAESAVKSGSLSDADRDYLAQLVASRADVPQAEARRRVDDFMASVLAAETKAKASADAAKKAAAQAAIYTALSMLIGAFIASVAAAVGGRLRDEHV